MNVLINGDIVLYGPVGGSFWSDEGFTATDVLQALAQVEGDITVRINSGGGVAWDGIAIYNALKAYTGTVSVVIEGVAASAASVIAMGGDSIEMPTGALMMIHNASSITWGTKEDHEKSIELLQKLDGQIAAIYAERTGEDLAEIHTLMDAETWMDGAEAVEKGFATVAQKKTATKASLFDYRLYNHAPKPLLNLSRKIKPVQGPLNAIRKEPSMTTTSPNPASAPAATIEPHAPTENDPAKAERTRIGAILNHAEATGREDLAKHLAFDTALAPEAAIAMLGKAPKVAAAPSPTTVPQTPPAATVAGLEVLTPPAPQNKTAGLDDAVARFNASRKR